MADHRGESAFSRWRDECSKRFGSVFDLPIGDSYGEVSDRLTPTARVLDVGAGARNLERYVTAPGQKYYALDPDGQGSVDFRSWDDVPRDLAFDVAVAHQVLEHVPMKVGFELVDQVFARLAPGGLFIASVPNPAHPNRHFSHAFHVQFWPMGDLFGLVRSAGFEVVALKRANKYRAPWNPLKRLFLAWGRELYRMDWADSLLIVGQKPGA